MSLFSKILEKLGLGKKKEEPAPMSTPTPAPTTSAKPVPPMQTPVAPAVAKPPAASGKPIVAGSGTVAKPETVQAVQAVQAPKPAAISEVDVVKKLEVLSEGSGLNWKVSIVDLLKLLDLDSSREAREEMAKELGCPPDLMTDSAKMNVWLHKTVLRKIAENGGNIPQELLD